MLKFLLDEQISPAVAQGLQSREASIHAYALCNFEDGYLRGFSDEELLKESKARSLTLVTYDLRTISVILKKWAESNLHHNGVVFVDNRTIASNNFGGLIESLIHLWAREKNADWTDRVYFITRIVDN